MLDFLILFDCWCVWCFVLGFLCWCFKRAVEELGTISSTSTKLSSSLDTSDSSTANHCRSKAFIVMLGSVEKRTDVVTSQQLFQRQSSLIKVKANFLHVTFPSTVLWAGPGGVNWGERGVCVDDEWWFWILSPQLSKELRGCQVIFSGWLLCL